MNVSLTPELEAFVEAAVKSGRYGTASEAVREALRLLEEREAKYQRLKQDIADGLASGRSAVGSFAEIAKRAQARWDAEHLNRSKPTKRAAAE